jgi:hypothetical protein
VGQDACEVRPTGDLVHGLVDGRVEQGERQREGEERAAQRP